jgi:hypothetical protein
MSDNSNNATEILNLWHEKFQQMLSDPKLTQSMLENYTVFFNNYMNYNNGNSQSSQLNDVLTKLTAIEARVDELANRIKLIERVIAKP